jgi:hypothetical protein
MNTNSRSGIAFTVSFRGMPDTGHDAKSLRERLGGGTEDRLGRALSDLLENSLLTGAVSRAFDAREKAAQAQEMAMGALNLPSAADIERLTRRLRSVSLRLEGIEESIDRVERQLTRLAEGLAQEADRRAKAGAAPASKPAKPARTAKRRGKA